MEAFSILKKMLSKASGETGMFNRQDSYTQMLLKNLNHKAGGQLYMTRWVPSIFAKAGHTLHIGGEDYKVYEVYSTYSRAHVEKYPKQFKVAIPQIGV
jgi:hypothetical protein